MLRTRESVALIVCVIVAYILITRKCSFRSSDTTTSPISKQIGKAVDGSESTIVALANKCRSVQTDNKSVRAICADIVDDMDNKKINQAISDALYLSMILEDTDDESLDELRFYTGEVVSTTSV